jgi:choline-sulfatase
MKKKSLLLILFVFLFLVAVGLFSRFNKREGQPAINNNQPIASDYNVIVIAFDAMQAKHLHAYGYLLDTTPNLDKFIEKSYLFKNTVSPASWTVPTFMSIFTSLYPSEHKVTNKFVEYKIEGTTTKAVKSNLKQLNPDAVTIAEIMKKNGYATGGFTGDAGLSAPFGFNQGFDEYYDKEMFGGLNNSISKATEWIDKNKDKKFFMFLHGYDAHGQYMPKEGYDYRYVAKPYKGIYTGSPKEQGLLREQGLANKELDLSDSDIAFWRAIYDEKINRADEQFAAFLKHVYDLGLDKNTIIVVLSDHGTEFYEHKRFDHGHTLYGELVDVLFAIHMPNQQEGKEINSLVSTLDLAPTILSLLNIKDPAIGKMEGINLAPAFTGNDISRDIYSETDYRLYTHKRSIQTPDGWKFIITMENLNKELYNINSDPKEENNLIDKEPKVAYELEQKIYSHLNSMNANGPWTLGCSPAYADQCLPLNKTNSLK